MIRCSTTKICNGSHCKGRKKELSEFSESSHAKGKFQSWCKACMCEFMREHNKTPEGRAVRRRASQRHYKTPKGKQTAGKAEQKYRSFAEGKEVYRKASRKHALKKLYNLSLDEYNTILQTQEGLCKLCKQPMDSPCVDHDHKTGKIRGLVHKRCNIVLGVVEKYLESPQAVNEYLTRTPNTHHSPQ